MKYNTEVTFASFVTRTRIAQGMTMRALADALGVSSPYLYDVEQGKRSPLKKEHLEKMVEIFSLNEEETALMFDLAGIDRGIVPLDLQSYILSNPCVRIVLRKARDKNFKEVEWQKIIAQMEKLGEK